MVDQTLHRLAHDLGDVLGRIAQPVGSELQIGGPRDLLVLDHHGRTGEPLQPLDTLLDDLERLTHLLHPDQVTTVGVAAVVGDDVEIVCLVTAVGLGLAQVVREPGGAQNRAGDAQRHAAGEVQIADAWVRAFQM